MTFFVFDNARVFDGLNGECAEGMSVAVEGDRIREVSDRPVRLADAPRIDLAGRTLMPGLIDLHIHAYASDVDLQKVDAMGQPYRTAHAVRMLGHALDCGFTTVRDVGGGDWSLVRALGDGLIRGPRFFYGGRVISMTGGHGDFRAAHVEGDPHRHAMCSCGANNSLSVIADGVDQCLAAVREQFRRGAHMIKLMASGGVVSPTDPIWLDHYREAEIRAIVDECVARRSYATAHCHTPSAIRRCVEFGVRGIEHGTLIDAETAALVAAKGAHIVPTMSIVDALAKHGRAAKLPADILSKIEEVRVHATSGLETMRTAGVKLGFGTDLVGHVYTAQAGEFLLRRDVFSPLEILRQATSTGAEILQHQGRLGCVAADAYADLIVVDGDPLKDIGLLAADGAKLPVIMRGGEMIRNQIGYRAG
ncbi:metal-dependent hydrolase family protein [Rhizorhabdus histidinilytica]|uniref:metal-dependent hydrolase family protein n=1 Tax=Rhizorhabdus histidinilytica TaxID=439228 RepID=UPI0032209C6D